MRIVWTKDEKRALLESMIDIIAFSPKLSNKEVLRRAQEDVIPPDRRTKITDQRVFNYKSMIHQARDAVALAAKNPPRPRPQPEPPAEPPKRLDTLGQVFELFIDALADRIMDKMIKAKQEVERQQMTPEQLDKVFDELYPLWKNAPLQPSPMEQLNKLTIRVKKPTALVIGLNGHQMECIKQSRPEVDFTFVTAEQAVSHYTINKDHTFLMTRFINHSVQNKYRKHPNLHFVNGGVTELKTLLHGIFNKEKVA
jgi:hypothetical protein